MIRMNKSFSRRLQRVNISEIIENLSLEPRLRAILEAPLVRINGCLLLEPLYSDKYIQSKFQDKTGFEAFTNHIHIDDYIKDVGFENDGYVNILTLQGVKAAYTLASRLKKEGSYRILLCLDSELPSISLRFFERRMSEIWGPEDPDEYQLEEVLMIDVN